MNPGAIEYTWKAILESERSDEIQFLDDEFLNTVAAHGSPQPRPEQSSVVDREPSAEVAA